ncbi:hypothetical protein [Acuticoccus sp. I52.16.1]|uniref:hypothetical protein n=1 Tax=Acuticoccus sp. I52.16.1 TaxID=2928472 RepID=UPI001FD31E15|nr:hypothetical protein [Acuticoccus sp. I52.16.1]UOM36297.1 hypothetical protein MRB58_08950 [Acuticoccus sp. I52.16.1]
MNRIVIGAAAFVALGGMAAADGFGDTQLSYRDGIVYDDDLVPGRGPNASYDGGDQYEPVARGTYGVTYGTLERTRRDPSPDLIGPDGRLRGR